MSDTADDPAVDPHTALRTYVLSDSCQPGDALPPERRLSEELGLSRRALQSARTRLEAEGLLRVEHGRGTTLLDPRRHGTLLLLPHLESPEVDADALSLRRVILAEAVACAAERATFEDLADLEELASVQAMPDLDDEAFQSGDLAFQRRLVRAAGSLPLGFVFHGLNAWLQARPAVVAALTADRKRVVAGYSAILNLVRGGDPELARGTVRRALEKTEAIAFGAPIDSEEAAATEES